MKPLLAVILLALAGCSPDAQAPPAPGPEPDAAETQPAQKFAVSAAGSGYQLAVSRQGTGQGAGESPASGAALGSLLGALLGGDPKRAQLGAAAGAAAGAPSQGIEPLVPVAAFATADAIPPADVGAFGIVAFGLNPTASARTRFLRVCNAMLAALPLQANAARAVELRNQMITVWPVTSPLSASTGCEEAVDKYDLLAGLQAIRDARGEGGPLTGAGPYLIGWSPAKSKGEKDALVLVLDLTGLTSEANFDEAFLIWRQRITEDPALWRNGFSLDLIRVRLRDFLDRHGEAILKVIRS